MNGRISIHVREDNTEQVTDRMRRQADRVVDAFADRIAAGARRNIAAHGLIATGRMLDSVGTEDIGEGRRVVFIGAFYAHFHEHGGRNVPARPSLAPAAEEQRQPFYRAMQEVASA